MIAILADIHGNYPALKKVLDYCKKNRISKIYSLGDIAGYYSMINESIELSRENSITHILGNHDYYLLSGKKCERSTVVNECIQFQKNIITNENFEWLKACKTALTIDNMHMVHGGWNDYYEEYLYEIDEDYFNGMTPGYYFSGHTHIQKLRTFSNIVYCNPGSVGQPRDRNPNAAFAVLDGKVLSMKRVEYNIDIIAEDMKKKQI